MKRMPSPHPFAVLLPVRFASPGFLLAALALARCTGTETDNPVVATGDFETPDRSRPDEVAPPCVPDDDDPGKPLALPRHARVGELEVAGDRYRGLVVRDATAMGDDAAAVETRAARSVGALSGEFHQLLAGPGPSVLVALLEPPAVSQGTLPEPDALDAHERVVELDLADPDAPRRVGAVDLAGDFWSMQASGDQLWVASGRRTPEQRGCDARKNACGFVYHEALVVSGYRVTESGLEPGETRELPMSVRALFTGAGAASVDESGVYTARFLPDGSLEAPKRVSLPGDAYGVGPLGLDEGALSFAWRADDGTSHLSRYDLEADPPALDLDFELSGQPWRPTSTFFGGYLFLDAAAYGASPELWDLRGDPAKVPLDASLRRLLPIGGDLGLEGQAALAVHEEPSGGETQIDLVSIEGGVVTVVESFTGFDISSPGNSRPAPPSLRDRGARIVLPGAGLPLALEPGDPANAYPRSSTVAYVAVGDAASPIEVALIETFVDGGTRLSQELRVTRGGTESRLALDAASDGRDLLPLDQGVLVRSAASREACEQRSGDCSSYVPGVEIVDLRAAPTLVARLPFPDVGLAAVGEPSRVEVRWDGEGSVLRLDDGRLAFVAQAYLTCQTEADCSALGLSYVPIAEAGVVMGVLETTCPPDVDPCVIPEPPPEPTVYGSADRQYFYVLDGVGSAGGPSWLFAGASELDSSSPRPDRASRFAAPGASGQTLFATRLERLDASGDPLPRGVSRVFVDRFEVSGSEVRARPGVNVPGRPIARVGAGGEHEAWLCVEPLAGEEGRNRLNLAQLGDAGAGLLESVTLEPSLGRSPFYGIARADLDVAAVPGSDDPLRVALVLTPENACGESRLSVFEARADGTLEPTGELALPADAWQLAALEPGRVLLRRGQVFALVALSQEGAPTLVSLESTHAPAERLQLSGGTLRAAGNRWGPVRLDF